MKAEDLPKFPHFLANKALLKARANGHDIKRWHPSIGGTVFTAYCGDGWAQCQAYIRIVDDKIQGTATTFTHPRLYKKRNVKPKLPEGQTPDQPEGDEMQRAS